MESRFFCSAMLMFLLLSVSGFAGITLVGEYTPGSFTEVGTDWSTTSNVTTGLTNGGTGSITIDGGYTLTTTGYCQIADYWNSTGSMTISGSGSQLAVDNTFFTIGDQGTGTMTIENGGSVTNLQSAYIGYIEPACSGEVIVTGSGSSWVSGYSITLGRYGATGILTVSDGGSVSSDYYIIASNPRNTTNATGTVTVTGTGSTLTATGGYMSIGSEGDGTLTVSAGADVEVQAGGATYLGQYSGSSGILTVTGAGSTYTEAGSVYVGGDASASKGTGTLNLADGGVLDFGGSMVVYSPTGTVNISGTGSNHGTLNVGSGDTLHAYGTSNFNINDGGVLSISSGGDAIFYNDTPVVDGTITVAGSGSTLKTGSSGNLGLTIGDSGDGILTVSSGGAVSSSTGAIGNGASSSGTVTVTGTGSTWTNSSALTVGVAGTGALSIEDGGAVSSLGGYLGYLSGSNGTVTVTGSGSTWTNSGSLHIGGDGPATEGTGTLNISSSGSVIAPNATLWDMGTLSGNSTLTLGSGSGMLTAYGSIKPGNSIGTLTVDGDVTLENGSEFELEIDNSGNSDRLAVTGDVTINNGSTVKVVSTETITGTQDYTFITANSVTGTFTTLDTALLQTSIAGQTADSALDYTETEVHLLITAQRFDDNVATSTPLGGAIGVALQEIANAGGNAMTTELQRLNTANLLDAYDQLGGTSLPLSHKVANGAVYKYMGTVSRRQRTTGQSMASIFSTGSSYADLGRFGVGNATDLMSNKPWGVWGQGFADYGDREAGGDCSGYDYRTYGGSFGFDYKLTPKWLLGVTMGYADSDVDVFGSHDGTDISTTYVGLYSTYETSEWYLDGAMAYGWSDYDSRRYISIGRINELARSSYDGDQIAGNIEGGLNWLWDGMLVQPLAGFQFSHETQDSYSETGAPNSNLHIHSSSLDSYQSSLGVKLTTQLPVDLTGAAVYGQLRGRWLHEFGDTSASITSGFVGYGSTFTIEDEGLARDTALLGCGLTAELNENVEMFFNYDASINRDLTSHLFSTGFEYRW